MGAVFGDVAGAEVVLAAVGDGAVVAVAVVLFEVSVAVVVEELGDKFSVVSGGVGLVSGIIKATTNHTSFIGRLRFY